MIIFTTPRCLEYGTPGHPESPERIRSVQDHLKERGYTFREPQPCAEADILRVHTKEHWQRVVSGDFFDPDTPVLPGIADFARLAAGSAIQAAETAICEGPSFSLMRPPGHHATRGRVMGFCYINNIAIAVAKRLDAHPGQRIAILDIDVHHGNGTEDIVKGWPEVLYISLHQTPLYPGTGLDSLDNIINFPLPPATNGTHYLVVLDKTCQSIADFKPSLLGVSAGFDAFQEDPLAQMDLDMTTFGDIGRLIAGLGIPTFTVMEGGYSAHLPECVEAFVRGMDAQD